MLITSEAATAINKKLEEKGKKGPMFKNITTRAYR